MILNAKGTSHMASDAENQAEASLMLLRASDKGHFAEVQAALSLGADPMAVDENGRTPLMLMSAGACSPAELETLIKVSNVNAQDSDGWTALFWALHFNPKLFEALLSAGADPLIADGYGETPLMVAASANNMSAVKRLAPISDLAAKNKEGQTAENKADSERFPKIASHLRAVELAKRERELFELIACDKSASPKARPRI